MWQISKQRLLGPIAAVLVATLAAGNSIPAEDKKKTDVPNKALAKAVVVHGKGRRGPNDFPPLKILKTKNRPTFPEVSKTDYEKIQASRRQKLTHGEKVRLAKSVHTSLRKAMRDVNADNADFSASTLTLTARSPWVDDKGYIEFQNSGDQTLDGSPSWISAQSIDLKFKCPKAGIYLITFYLRTWFTDAAVTLTVAPGDGIVDGPASIASPKGWNKELVFPVFYTVSDTTNPWHRVTLQNTDLNQSFQFESVDVQYMGQKQ